MALHKKQFIDLKKLKNLIRDLGELAMHAIIICIDKYSSTDKESYN